MDQKPGRETVRIQEFVITRVSAARYVMERMERVGDIGTFDPPLER